MFRGLLFGLLGALAVAVIEAGLFFTLRRAGIPIDVALLVLSVFSLIALLAVGAYFFLFLPQRDASAKLLEHAPEPQRLPEYLAHSNTAEMWHAAVELESVVRYARGSSDPGYVKVSAQKESVREKTRPVAVPGNTAVSARVDAERCFSAERREQKTSPSAAAGAMGEREVIDALDERERAVVQVLNRAKSRLNDAERLMENRIHLINGETIKAHITAKRVISALERRIVRVNELALNREPSDLLRALQLLESDLAVPADTVNSLMNTEVIPVLPADQWHAVLDRLLTYAENSLKQLDLKTRRPAY